MIAVLGEALVDVAGTAERPVEHPGGSPLNVAVGLARLGQPTAFLGRLARDHYGTVLREHAAASGVDLQYVVEASQPSSVAYVELDDAGAARYDFVVEGAADFTWTDPELAFAPYGARALHFGSLASWLPPGADVIDRRLARLAGSTFVSYDPNVRPALQPYPERAREEVERSVRRANLVKASEEDVRYLYGDGATLESVVACWLALGPELVVITRGGHGAAAYTARGAVQRPSPPVEVVDTVGAGDAFMAGLLDALLRRDLPAPRDADLAAVLDEAAHVAAITCTRAGADPPWRAELTGRDAPTR